MLYIISTAVIIGIIYHSSRNIIVCMLMHFTVNFMASFFKCGVLDWLGMCTVLYVIVAIGFSVWHIKRANFNKGHNKDKESLNKC